VASGPCDHRPPAERWVWDGRPLACRRVLVRCYRGLGDTLQFARFLPQLQRLAGEVIVLAQPLLAPLLRTMRGGGRILSMEDGDHDHKADVELEIMELPHALRTTLETLPADVPYFSVPAAARLSEQLCVGVVAETGPSHPGRSVPPALMGELSQVPGVALYSLQPGARIPGAIDAGEQEILRAAARVRGLDLVVTADTMMAHLSGALGVPTWTLLRAEPDWRWLEDRDDSPWYPTMRLFRQSRAGDWEPVVAEVCQQLRRLRLERLP
jgi:hypothetical protein